MNFPYRHVISYGVENHINIVFSLLDTVFVKKRIQRKAPKNTAHRRCKKRLIGAAGSPNAGFYAVVRATQ